LDVHVRPLGVGFSVSNEAAGHAALIARLRPLRSKRIVLEATGGYERALWLALSEAGLVAAVVISGRKIMARYSALPATGSNLRRFQKSKTPQ
jgi:transposase